MMPDGRPFQDANEFKHRLLEDRDKLARAFIEHLCTYGLRRALAFDVQDDLKAIATEARKNQYRISVIFINIRRIRKYSDRSWYLRDSRWWLF